MLSKVYSAAHMGINAYLVEVEVDIPSHGLPGWHMVGLLETAVKEAKERVAAAIRNSGYQIVNRKTIINLSPGHIKKSGVHFDLPIAVALLAAWGIVKPDDASRYLYAGELSLNGAILPVNGALLTALAAKDGRFKGVILPARNTIEAKLVDNIDIIGASTLVDIVHFLNKGERPNQNLPAPSPKKNIEHHDFAEVRGQELAKRGLEIAAAGGHNVLLIGPPGTGKTMLAERLPSILPPLTHEEALETAKVLSVYGLIGNNFQMNYERPFRAPHHSASYAGLIGGGGGVPKIGEISLAHNGVLFLDEMPEFRKDAIEVLRQPIESGYVRISRMGISVSYPARFMLVAAMNPCRCGYFGHPTKQCICTLSQIQNYRGKLSGPLLDRIDLQIEVSTPTHEDLLDKNISERSEAIRKRVIRARRRQDLRYKDSLICNAQLKGRQIQEYFSVGKEEKRFLKDALQQLGLSARALHRTLKIAKTIADLAGADEITIQHLAEAMQYRSFDRLIM